LAQDSEIVVLKASGLSLFQVARPIALLAMLFTIFALLLSSIWLPQAYHNFSVMKKALVSATTLTLKPETFNQAIPGLTIYIQEQQIGGQLLKGILIHDRRNPKESVTLTARSGQLLRTKDGGTLLHLTNGSRHQKLQHGQYRQLVFATYNLDLGISLGLKTQDKKEQLDEMGMGKLHSMIGGKDPERAYKARMEWHRRLAFPGATLILGLFAVPLGLQQSHRSGRSYGFVVAVFILIIHFLLLALGESLAGKELVDPIFGFWLPNLLMASLTAHVMLETSRGRPFKAAIWLSQMLATLPQKLLRPTPSP